MSDADESHISDDRQVMLYESRDHTVHLDVRVDSDTVWLTQQQLAALFGRDVTTIRRHIKNARGEELQGIPVSAFFALTASDGKTYQVEHYKPRHDPLRRIPRQVYVICLPFPMAPPSTRHR